MTTKTHSLADLMDKEYVKDRYNFDSVSIIPIGGKFFAVAVLDTGAEFVVYTASADKEAASLVNLSGVYGGPDSPDLSEHIFEYYSALPKYQGVNETELWSFCDDLAEKFTKGVLVESHDAVEFAAKHLFPLIEKLKQEGDVYVEFSELIHKQMMTVLGLTSHHLPYAGADASNWCAICDGKAYPGEDFCEKCKGEVTL